MVASLIRKLRMIASLIRKLRMIASLIRKLRMLASLLRKLRMFASLLISDSISVRLMYYFYYISAIFGELSSSDEDDEKDVNIMDSGEDEMSRSSYMPRQTSYASLDTANSESQDANDSVSGKNNP